MSCRILHGADGACLYDPVTGWAFGPVFVGVVGNAALEDAEAEAEAFLAYCMDKPGVGDPRKVEASRLEELYALWRARQVAGGEAEDTTG